VINRELGRHYPERDDTADRPAWAETVRQIVGDDDLKVAEVLKLQPTVAELEEAFAWAEGEDDVMGELEKPLTGKAAQIYDIITADKDDEAPE